VTSPRDQLLAGLEDILTRIRQANGYLTDAGANFTREPRPASDDSADEFITAVWSRQERATDPALVRTHRLTTVQVAAKVPAGLTDAQARLDAITTDIEMAMEKQEFRFPSGIQYPKYQAAEPALPQQAGAGWIGVFLTYTSHIPIRRPAA
jgi:hypothetical protein